jgi:hypothetical protein
MKIKKRNNSAKSHYRPLYRCLSGNLSPPEDTIVKELLYAKMSGIIPGRLHLCRACFLFIPA